MPDAIVEVLRARGYAAGAAGNPKEPPDDLTGYEAAIWGLAWEFGRRAWLEGQVAELADRVRGLEASMGWGR